MVQEYRDDMMYTLYVSKGTKVVWFGAREGLAQNGNCLHVSINEGLEEEWYD